MFSSVPMLENIRFVSETLGYIAGIASLLFIAYQIKKERRIKEFEVLLKIEEKFSKLLIRTRSDKALDEIWQYDKFAPIFDKIIHEPRAGAYPCWDCIASSQDKETLLKCYQTTREILDTFEQAHSLHYKGWLKDKEIWKKWRSWMLDVKTSNPFAPAVLHDLDQWYTDRFIRFYKQL